jgi:hypothetical protein
MTVEQIIDLGNTRMFVDAPDITPAIQIVRKLEPTNGNQAEVAVFSRGDDISMFHNNLEGRRFEISLHDQPDEGWQLKSDASRQLFTRLMGTGKPLGNVVEERIYTGIKTGLNEAFIIDDITRSRLIKAEPLSAQLMKPIVRGEDLRPWYQENEGRWLICLPSGWTVKTFPELKSRDEKAAWEKLKASHPGLTAYLEPFAMAGRKRQDKGQFWWELRACDYYNAFETTKIFWADIAKFPRFSWDEEKLFVNNRGYILPTEDISLVGILQSRITWFCIMQLCAPLGERLGLTRYLHFTQYIKHLPIPTLNDEQQTHIGKLDQQVTHAARQRYRLRQEMAQRIKSDLGAGQSKITDRLDEWWRLSWQEFRDEVRKSFKNEIPLKERRAWQELLQEESAKIEHFTVDIIRIEQELNTIVYAAFGLDQEEIQLIEQETKYQSGEW